MNINKCQIVLITNNEKCKKDYLNTIKKKKNEFDEKENKINITKIKPLKYFENDFIDWTRYLNFSNFDKSFLIFYLYKYFCKGNTNLQMLLNNYGDVKEIKNIKNN